MSGVGLLTDGAARDLDELYAAAYDRGGSGAADSFLDRMEVVFGLVAAAPASGRPLPDLVHLGLGDALQWRDGALRVVYRRHDAGVLIVAIAPVVRSLQSLLQRRMLDS